MGRLIATLYTRTHRHRWWWAVLVLVAAALSLWKESSLHFTSDLFDALPEDRTIGQYRHLLTSAGAAGDIVVGFSVSDPALLDSAGASADRFVEHMAAEGPDGSGRGRLPIVRAFTRPDPEMALRWMEDLFEDLPRSVDDAALARLAHMDSAAVDSSIAAVRGKLMQPMSMMVETSALRDPFGLTATRRQELEQMGDLLGATLIDGRLAASDSSAVFVMVKPEPGAREGDRAQALVDAIDRIMRSSAAPGVATAQFGALPMNVVNARRIAQDATWTMCLALVIILTVLFVRYRRASIPVLFLLPPVVGFAFALGAFSLFRSEISGIALGAGSALLGIALDYSFHYFTHLQHRRDVAITLREISSPLLLGCATTVLAFLGLLLLDAPVLADMGLLAAFILAGSAFTVLVVLPHFAPVPAERMGREKAQEDQRPQKNWQRWMLPAVVLITVALLPFVNDVRYEDDPERMSWMPDDMRDLRARLQRTGTGLHTVFVTGRGEDLEAAKVALEDARAELEQAGTLNGAQVMFPTDLRPSERTKKERTDRWTQALGYGRGAQLARWLEYSGDRHGFTPEAFAPFTAQLEHPRSPPDGFDTGLGEDFFGGVVMKEEDGVSVAALMRVPGDRVDAIEGALKDRPDVAVLHRGLLADRLTDMAGGDLNTILLYTALIVFFALLVNYGRIELALLTFLPMALGWIWILGLCGLTGIRFNMVNIVVCTFIFGLGDDYCIFTSEGLLGRYRNGRDHVRSFRGAVILSAITTLIGTGVLVFAQHPALRSIAVLSVTGMVALLAISLTVQPALFRFFVSGRTGRGRHPFTLLSFCISLFSFSYFLLGCLLLIIVYVLFRLLPGFRRAKQHAVRVLLMLFTRSLVYAMVNVRKDIHGFREAIARKPSIVIANHSSFVDILCMLMISPRVLMMTNRWVWSSPFFGAIVRYAGFLRTEDSVEVNVARAREAMERGLSIIIFPEGTRSPTGRIGRFHKGPFHLAAPLKAPVVPVLLHGIGHAMRKGDAMLKNGRITMRTLDPIAWDDPRFEEGLTPRTKGITAWFREEYERLRAERETPGYFHGQLVSNYLYKGPVLEWYTRIKSRIDEPLHTLIHQRIAADARVVDLGCGHGMLSHLLHWCASEREITGVDHDEEKIAIAQHCFSHHGRITFAQADLEAFDPPPADIFILKDVLHYLQPEVQQQVLMRCGKQLAANGMIFVRDGFTDEARRHRRTWLTERFSVGTGFNRAKQELHFPDHAGLEKMAGASGMRVEWAITGGRTSNELAILHRR